MSDYAIVIFIMVMLYTVYMGFNDGSTAIATTIVSRAMPMRSAVIIAAITQFLVPIVTFLISSEALSVAMNINSNIVSENFFTGLGDKEAFAYIFSAMFLQMPLQEAIYKRMCLVMFFLDNSFHYFINDLKNSLFSPTSPFIVSSNCFILFLSPICFQYL